MLGEHYPPITGYKPNFLTDRRRAVAWGVLHRNLTFCLSKKEGPMGAATPWLHKSFYSRRHACSYKIEKHARGYYISHIDAMKLANFTSAISGREGFA
jgi:hypothetical protein